MSFVVIEVEGWAYAEPIRSAFFAAARAMLGVGELHFEMVPIQNGQRWEADGAVFTCLFNGDPPMDPVPPRDSPGASTYLELRVGEHTLSTSYAYLLANSQAVLPHEQRAPQYGIRDPNIKVTWPGLVSFDAIHTAMCNELQGIEGFQDWTFAASRICRNVEVILDAGDTVAADTLLRRCDLTFEKPSGVSIDYWKVRFFSLTERLRPLTAEEEGQRATHCPHITPSWQRVAEAGGAAGWEAWEARHILAMQRPWDLAEHSAMPPGGAALGLAAMSHPDWPWARPANCPPPRRWSRGHLSVPVWRAGRASRRGPKLSAALQAIGFSESTIKRLFPSTGEPLAYALYSVSSDGEVVYHKYELTEGKWLAGVIALPVVSRNPQPPLLWQKVSLRIAGPAGILHWVWFQAGEPGRGLCLHVVSNDRFEFVLTGEEEWVNNARKAIRRL